MKRGFVDTVRGQIHYAAEGEGEPLLLLHQNPRSWRIFTRLSGVLSERYRVIAIDLPGFGDSDPLPEPFTIADLAGVVRECMDAMGLEKVRAFGRHTGAIVSGELAITWPDRVEALVFSGYPFLPSDQERQEHLTLAQQPIGTPGGLAIVVPDLSGSHLTKLWHRASRRVWEAKGIVPTETVSEEELDFIHDLVMDQLKGRKTVPGGFRAVFSYDSPSRLPLIKAPTLLMQPTGEYEREIARRSHGVRDYIPGAKLVTIPNEDVYTIFWRAEEMGRIVLEYLADPAAFKSE